MNCKPGEMAWITKSAAGNYGRMVEVVGPVQSILPGDLAYPGEGHMWHCKSSEPLYCTFGIPSTEFAFPDIRLRPFRDNPGNEDFVTKARLSLPRAKPAVGPVTITERGEVV